MQHLACPLQSFAACAQQQQSYDTSIVIHRLGPNNGWAVYALLDGHDGEAVTRYVSKQLVSELQKRLPSGSVYLLKPHIFAEQTRRAVTAAFLAAASALHGSSLDASDACCSTATLVLHTGALLTVANVGSSEAWLDIGHTPLKLTTDHRVGYNDDETDRMLSVGAQVARQRLDLSGPAADPEEPSCGPLRVWPGGHLYSRCFTLQPAMPVVIPHPHIQQVWLPSSACRLVLANAAVWGAFPAPAKAASMLRSVSLDNAPGAVMERAANKRRARGDRVVVVVDFLSDPAVTFKGQMRSEMLVRSKTSESLSPRGWQGALHRSSCTSSSSAGGSSSLSSWRPWRSNSSSGGASCKRASVGSVSSTPESATGVSGPRGGFPRCTSSSSGGSSSYRCSSRGAAPPSTMGCWPLLSCFRPADRKLTLTTVTEESLHSSSCGCGVEFVARVDSLDHLCYGFYGPLSHLVTLLDCQLSVVQQGAAKSTPKLDAPAAAAVPEDSVTPAGCQVVQQQQQSHTKLGTAAAVQFADCGVPGDCQQQQQQGRLKLGPEAAAAAAPLAACRALEHCQCRDCCPPKDGTKQQGAEAKGGRPAAGSRDRGEVRALCV